MSANRHRSQGRGVLSPSYSKERIKSAVKQVFNDPVYGVDDLDEVRVIFIGRQTAPLTCAKKVDAGSARGKLYPRYVELQIDWKTPDASVDRSLPNQSIVECN